MENIRILQMQNFIVIYVLWQYILKQSNTCNATYLIDNNDDFFFIFSTKHHYIKFHYNCMMNIESCFDFLSRSRKIEIFFSKYLRIRNAEIEIYIFKKKNVCDFQLTSIRDMEVQLYELNLKTKLSWALNPLEMIPNLSLHISREY